MAFSPTTTFARIVDPELSRPLFYDCSLTPNLARSAVHRQGDRMWIAVVDECDAMADEKNAILQHRHLTE